MEKKSVKNLDIKDVAAKLGQNMAWVFTACLILLILLEALQIKKSVDFVLTVNTPAPAAPVQKGLRVDFDGYNKVVEMKKDSQTFYPTSTPQTSPFGLGN